MSKYFRILKNQLAAALEWRANLVTLVLFEIIHVTAVLILWTFVFQNRNDINGMTFDQILLYYVLTPFIGIFTSVNISDGLGSDIKDGHLSLNLLEPYKIWLGRLCNAVAVKIYNLLFIAPIYLLVLLIYTLTAQNPLISLQGIFLSLLFIILAFFLHFFLDLALGLTAFWIDDVWAFRHVKDIFFGVFGGQTFPLDFLAQNLKRIFEFLPFKFFYYIPVAYLLGSRTPNMLGNDMLGIFMWTGTFVFISFILWRFGLKRYEAFGN
ncbi:MAG TPA: ABC-2 family transporter protein [Candidatus Dojkabacteria bacterium]|nr:ABC-2 family transporter protein [Candidatus Dojkabacteria bacterium]